MRRGHMVVPGGVAVSYERGTPVMKVAGAVVVSYERGTPVTKVGGPKVGGGFL